jgi:archaellum component FlaC
MGMGSKGSDYKQDDKTTGATGAGENDKLQSGKLSQSIKIISESENARKQEKQAELVAIKQSLDRMTNHFNSFSDTVKWNKMQMEKAEKDCSEINVKLKDAVKKYSLAESRSMRVGSSFKERTDTEAANTYMYAVKQKANDICNNYGLLKDKYMKSVNELNTLKNKIDDLQKKHDSLNASVGGGSSKGLWDSMVSPIINIFLGNNDPQDCSGRIGCGKSIDYSFPSPFGSSKESRFVPKPYNESVFY